MRSTGVRAAVSKETILEGERLLTARGAKITGELVHIGAVQAVMDPEVAVALRNHPLVDFVEPRRWGTLDGVRVPAAGRMRWATRAAWVRLHYPMWVAPAPGSDSRGRLTRRRPRRYHRCQVSPRTTTMWPTS